MNEAVAQQPPASESSSTTLPQVTVDPVKPRPAKRKPVRSSANSSRRTSRNAANQRQNQPPVQAAPADAFAARTGTVGYFSNSTSVATKTNTPLLNIPQSISVLSKDFIQDQGTHSITDLTRYVPGVAVHQGEGNRDELVIRGVDSSANFFVNGFRDDVQYFRDLYNAQSVEVLKGPSALIFGRGAGGGLVNRTLKEADGTRIYEATVQSGSWGDRRITLDAGQAVNQDLAVRLNAFYEGSDTFRDFGHLERYGINPTLTWRPTQDTKIKLSYEYYHDSEVPDRGNPSIAIPGGASRFNPTTPFAPNGDFSTFFGSPLYNRTHADVQQTIGVIEHDFGGGLTVKNSTVYADINRAYQNVYPGSAANLATKQFTYSAYNNTTNRENFFNQTDFTYKAFTGPIFHTIAFGSEFDRQTGLSLRNTGFFSNGTRSSDPVNPFDPTYLGLITFRHLINNPAVAGSTGDANSVYRLNVSSGYIQDQADITRWLQLVGGVRFDHFDLTATDLNVVGGARRNRVDDLVSPRAAIILKPADNFSIYTAYSISYLPASGDQFSALSPATLILQPQRFENTELGVKWDIQPKLQYTAAIYKLNRSNQPIPTTDGSNLQLPNGATRVKGFETALNGYVTDLWQSIVGYSYTDARIAKDLTVPSNSLPIVAGNRVQLVPYNQFSWWNKYQFAPTWSAALGVIYFSDSYASNDDSVRLPGFVRFDAALYWQLDKTWRAQFNVENIFNKGYWASADGDNNISPGQSRTFRVLVKANL
ncbi:MAG: TonB-dependent siderophore receptor [Xanthobacteraceae bacterium]|nr:TonB-dependent siderophore receptor [Xanthobacteraceae bacterium]